MANYNDENNIINRYCYLPHLLLHWNNIILNAIKRGKIYIHLTADD